MEERAGFHDIVRASVQEELDELRELVSDDTLPDLWDVAYEDLTQLYGSSE